MDHVHVLSAKNQNPEALNLCGGACTLHLLKGNYGLGGYITQAFELQTCEVRLEWHGGYLDLRVDPSFLSGLGLGCRGRGSLRKFRRRFEVQGFG